VKALIAVESGFNPKATKAGLKLDFPKPDAQIP